MIKRVIKPFQEVLLDKNLCVGCTHPLSKAESLGNLTENSKIVSCKCKRKYILDKKMNKYRRATLQEEQQYLKRLKK